jgi:hypothetical protein
LLGRTVPELEHDLFVVPVSDFTAVLRAVEHLYLIKMQYLHYTLSRQYMVKAVVRQDHHMGMVAAHQVRHRDLGKVKAVVRQDHHTEMEGERRALPQLQYSRVEAFLLCMPTVSSSCSPFITCHEIEG